MMATVRMKRPIPNPIAALKAYKQLKQAEDPTTLFCTNCGNAYPLNSPRVRRSFPSGHVLDTAGLCWVCARLKNSVSSYESENERNILEGI